MGRGEGAPDFADIERAGLRDIEPDPAPLRPLFVFEGRSAGGNEAEDLVKCFRERRTGAWPQFERIAVKSFSEINIFCRADSEEDAERQVLDQLTEMEMIEMFDTWFVYEDGT